MSNISSEQASKDPHLKPSKLLTTVGLIFPTYLQETTEIARKLARQQGNQAGSGQLPTKIDTRGISRESLEEMGIHPENSLLALYADLLSLALLALPIMLK
ncbi:hypothetical protein KC921_02835, partial [Candidatus Woesebacteria bacterium]|nr:hypothetical protein [Candidatus Woesebacteria bacterium]